MLHRYKLSDVAIIAIVSRFRNDSDPNKAFFKGSPFSIYGQIWGQNPNSEFTLYKLQWMVQTSRKTHLFSDWSQVCLKFYRENGSQVEATSCLRLKIMYNAVLQISSIWSELKWEFEIQIVWLYMRIFQSWYVKSANLSRLFLFWFGFAWFSIQ